jgi:hypothetical protein
LTGLHGSWQGCFAVPSSIMKCACCTIAVTLDADLHVVL